MNPVTLERMLVHDGFLRELAGRLLRDPHAADDAVQETWSAALRAGSATGGGRAWLAAVTRNFARQSWRSAARRRAREERAARADEVEDAARVVERESTRRTVVEALLSLDEPYRRTLILRFYEDLPPRRVAAREGVPVETVRTRTRRGLEQLRRRLDVGHDGERGRWQAALVPLALRAGRGGLPAWASASAAALLLVALVTTAALLLQQGDPPAGPPAPVLPGGAAAAGAVTRPGAPVGSQPFQQETLLVDPGKETAETFAGGEPLDAGGDPRLLVLRIVDGDSGHPLQDAELFLVKEPDAPLAGRWHAARSARSDGDGWVRISLEALPAGFDWVFLTADGHAPRAWFGIPDDSVVRLFRGSDVDVEVRDARGRPLAGALVDLVLGCGHTPAVRSVTTDGRGRAVLRGVEPGRGGVWVVAPGQTAARADLDGALPGILPLVVSCEPGLEVSGTVRDREGRPVAGAAVGAPIAHRGPWTLSNARGAFRLQGVEPGSSIEFRPPWDTGTSWVFETPPRGTPRHVVLPAEPGAEEAALPVAVEVVAAADGAPALGVEVVATRRGDGYTDGWRLAEKDNVTLRLPRGAYDLVVDGGLSGWGSARRSLVIGTAPTDPLRLEVRRAPLARLRVPPAPTQETRVRLVSRRAVRELDAKLLAAGRLALPEERDLAFVLEAGSLRSVVPVPDDRSSVLERGLDLRWPRPVMLRLKTTDPGGRPLVVRAVLSHLPRVPEPEELRGPAASTLEIPCFSVGRRALNLVPADAAYAPRSLAVALPHEAGAVVDLGTVALLPVAAPPVVAAFPDGRPAAGASVALWTRGELLRVRLDEGGRWRHPWRPAPGARLRVDAGADWFPVTTTVEELPLRITWPANRVRFEVLDEAGKPLPAATVTIGQESFSAPGGKLELRGLPTAPQPVFLAAPGRKGRRFDLAPGPHQELRVRCRLAPR